MKEMKAMAMSMTGYGRADISSEEFDITVEIRSVNHKFFEFSVRMPRSFGFAEDKLKKLCQSRINRGKVDMFINVADRSQNNVKLEVNHSLAREYVDAVKELGETYGLNSDISAATLLRFPEVFTVTKASLDEEHVWEMLSEVANRAIDEFLAMRCQEGEKLKEDVLSRMNTILGYVETVEARSPETVVKYRARLEEKMRELLGDVKIDEQRLITETGIFADRIAVDEETVRLRSHFKQMSNMLSQDGPIGRSLDFLVQEMNRETNTIGSKCQDIDISHIVVAIKSEIEKMREQIQNIE